MMPTKSISTSSTKTTHPPPKIQNHNNEQQQIKEDGNSSAFLPDSSSPQEQRIVFLPGPHKTSSSSVQFNLCQWIHKRKKNKNENADRNATNDRNTEVKGGLEKHWTLPIPNEIHKLCKFRCGKLFAPLAFDLNFSNDPKQRNKWCGGNDIIDLYRDEFQKQWNNGRSLVIASEVFDWIANNDKNSANQLLENLLHILPIENTSAITAVVPYRAPRLDHLLSLWHQRGMKEGKSFYDYLMTLVSVHDELRVLDSLLLAERLINRSINTVLIDLSGVKKHGYDISLVIACDVLDADCDAEKHFVGEENAKPVIKNIKHHSDAKVNVTDAQLNAIDKIIESYDCNFQHILKNDKLQVLYPNELERIMNSCSSNNADYPKSHDQLLKKIIEILSNE
jgi:hypothetical protein